VYGFDVLPECIQGVGIVMLQSHLEGRQMRALGRFSRLVRGSGCRYAKY
jgi:hypothetical protein